MSQKHLTSLQHKSPSKTIWFLGITNSIIVGVLLIWLILGNLLATKQEKAFQAELGKFSKRFPKKEMNVSAQQLDRLRSKLTTGNQKYTIIRQSLNNYLSAQTTRSGNRVDELPESIHDYLKTHVRDLATIRKYVLNSEVPNYCTVDLEKTLDNPFLPLPSLLDKVEFNKILLVDALEASRIGDDQRVLDNLHVSWRINQSFYECPSLISSLIAIINSNLQIGVLRKVNPPSVAWEQRLPEGNIKQSLLNSLDSESFWSASILRLYSPSDQNFWQQVGGDLEASPVGKIQQLFQQPYFRLAGVAEQSQMRNMVVELSKQDICSFDIQVLLDQYPNNWWYSMDSRAFLSQWQKPYKNLINIELTQKILQIKRTVMTSKKAPPGIPGIETSKVCPNLRWKYQTDANGNISISLQNLPKWLVTGKKDLPLKYELSVKDLLKQPTKRQRP